MMWLGISQQDAPLKFAPCEQWLYRDAKKVPSDDPGLIWVWHFSKVMAGRQEPSEASLLSGPVIGVRRQGGREMAVDCLARAFRHVIDEMNRCLRTWPHSRSPSVLFCRQDHLGRICPRGLTAR